MPPTDPDDPPLSRNQRLRGSLTYDELDAILDPLVSRLFELDPEAVLRTRQEGGGLLRLVAEHLNTSRDFFAAREAMERRPYVFLRVRRGDWVTIGGWKLRIGSISRDGQVLTERLDEDGEVLSAAWIDGQQLTPEPPPEDPVALALAQRREDALELADPFRLARLRQETHATRLVSSRSTPPPC